MSTSRPFVSFVSFVALVALNATREAEEEARRRILSELCAAGGDTVWMQPPFFCDDGSNIELGERVFFNFNCIVLDVCGRHHPARRDHRVAGGDRGGERGDARRAGRSIRGGEPV